MNTGQLRTLAAENLDLIQQIQNRLLAAVQRIEAMDEREEEIRQTVSAAHEEREKKWKESQNEHHLPRLLHR